MEFPSCPICLSSPANCPVQLNNDLCKGCNRSKGLCLVCCHKLFQLDIPERFRNPCSLNCPFCRDQIDLTKRTKDNTYTKCDPYWELLDMSKTEQKCANCDETFESPYDLEKHLNTECPNTIIQCSGNHCDFHCERHLMISHENQCRFVWCRCLDCQKVIKRSDLTEHRKACPMRVVVCPECGMRMKKCEAVNHAKLHEIQIINDYNARVVRLQHFCN